NSRDARWGQRVLVDLAASNVDASLRGRTMLLLDRAPHQGHWWLQDPDTGAISRDWSVHVNDLHLLGDDYRDVDTITLAITSVPEPTVAIVQYRRGVWSATRSRGPGQGNRWAVNHNGKWL